MSTGQLHAPGSNGMTNQGTVYKKALGAYVVHTGSQVITCSISNKLRKQLVYPIADPHSLRKAVVAVKDIDTVDPIAIGDVVTFIDAGNQSGVITKVLPRKNKLSRRAAGKKPLEQVIVSNVDQIIPVFAAAWPDPKWNLLDRYLATAEWAGIPAFICVTKLDLAPQVEFQAELAYYERLGYPVVLTSTVDGRGLVDIKDVLRDKVSVFIGKSGVGKSSLLNAIQPGLALRAKAISESTGKGKHTTTYLEMFPLDFGGSVVDTPGMREFNLGCVDEIDLAIFFPEMRPLVGACRFGLDCSHTHEPGCAIQEAVSNGTISKRRYNSYLRLQAGEER